MGRGRHRQWRKGLPKGPSPPKLGALGHDVCAPQASPLHPWEKAAETVLYPTGCNGTPPHLRPHSSREMGCKYPTSQSLAQVGEEPDPVRPCKFMHKLFGGCLCRTGSVSSSCRPSCSHPPITHLSAYWDQHSSSQEETSPSRHPKQLIVLVLRFIKHDSGRHAAITIYNILIIGHFVHSQGFANKS